MYELEDKDEEAAFYELDSHRGLAVVAPAIVENRLTALLKAAMRQDEKVLHDLFHPGAPLGDFGVKIKLAYVLNLIHEDVYKDLTTVTKIRNAFAHDVRINSFDVPQIKDRVQSLRALSVWKSLLEKCQAELKEKPENNDLRLRTQILWGELSTVRDGFRMCLRMYISKLVTAEKALKAQKSSSASSPRSIV